MLVFHMGKLVEITVSEEYHRIPAAIFDSRYRNGADIEFCIWLRFETS